MPITPNTHGGGAKTNANGLAFEQTTSLKTALENSGYSVDLKGNVFYGNKKIGLCLQKHDFNKFLQANGVDMSVNSDKLLPDDVLINMNNHVIYIIEKKFQSVAGSVDEKLQTCLYKKRQYSKLITQTEFSFEYTYVLNDWFKQPKYKDVKEYIEDVGCHYFFNKIPLDFLGL